MKFIAPMLASCLALTVAPAAAQSDLETMTLASNLGTVLGSEQFCGLTYDQGAIGRFIDERAPAGDMGFASFLQMSTSTQSFSNNEMSESARTAHCRAVANTARHYGFIE